MKEYSNYQIIVDPIDGWFVSFPNFVVLHIHRLNVNTLSKSKSINSYEAK